VQQERNLIGPAPGIDCLVRCSGKIVWSGSALPAIVAGRQIEKTVPSSEAGMNEAEWLGATDPHRLLQFLRTRGRPDERKLRLFACACVRRLLPLLQDRRCRTALETSEEFADGRSTRRQLETVRRAAQQVASAAWHTWMSNPERESEVQITQAILAVTLSEALPAAWEAATRAALVGSLCPLSFQAGLVREIFGNPFRPTSIERNWLAWNSGIVARLVRGIHEEQRFGDLPILADALEEAGCLDENLLRHCRQEGGHVRGCWVVDVLRAASGA
jgi:hypothetical protein